MATTTQTVLSEILIRFDATGAFQGAQKTLISRVVDSTTGALVSATILPPQGLASGDLDALITSANATLVTSLSAQQALTAQLSDDLTAASAAVAAAATVIPPDDTTGAAAQLATAATTLSTAHSRLPT